MSEEPQKVKILTQKDLEISYFCGSGAGGQARNKVASGVQMIHKESGAIGRASDSRSQGDNKKAAFLRLMEHPKMKLWLSKKVYEVNKRESMEDTIRRDTSPDKIKYEIRENGKWREVGPEYFDSEEARKIHFNK